MTTRHAHTPPAAPAPTAVVTGLPATDGARDGDGSPHCRSMERPAPVRASSGFADALLAEAVESAADALFAIRSATGSTPTSATYHAARNLRDIAEALLAEITRYAVSRPSPDVPLVVRGTLDIPAVLDSGAPA